MIYDRQNLYRSTESAQPESIPNSIPIFHLNSRKSKARTQETNIRFGVLPSKRLAHLIVTSIV